MEVLSNLISCLETATRYEKNETIKTFRELQNDDRQECFPLC